MRMHEVLEEVVPSVDPERPRYLMGVGTPYDLVRAIGCGVDMFDCVLPTRNARNGQALLRTGKVTIKQARYKTTRCRSIRRVRVPRVPKGIRDRICGTCF
jgi:queuine tRNA-ribosyltransferase